MVVVATPPDERIRAVETEYDPADELVGEEPWQPLTPLEQIQVNIAGRRLTVSLKLESFNRHGSIKDRTAAALLESLRASSALSPETEVVESTSGNLGIALAARCAELGLRFRAVVDPRTPSRTIARIRELGACVDMVDAQDETGGYLLTRLARIRALLAEDGVHRVWPNQYGSEANPRAHETGTGPELLYQAGPELDAVFVAVSTGGTLAGIARCLRRERPDVEIVAVDSAGSVALGGRPGPRLLTGIGSSQRSAFLEPWMYDTKYAISDDRAVAVCRALRYTGGPWVGGSSGAAIAACLEHLERNPRISHPAVICPDHGRGYADTLYDDQWLAKAGLYPGLGHAERMLFAPRLAGADEEDS